MASDSGRKRLLVLGAGPAQLGLLEAARKRDVFVIAVDRDPTAPGFAFADRRAIISTEDERGIERLAAAERIDGVIAPGIDWPVGIAARVAGKLGLPPPASHNPVGGWSRSRRTICPFPASSRRRIARDSVASPSCTTGATSPERSRRPWKPLARPRPWSKSSSRGPK